MKSRKIGYFAKSLFKSIAGRGFACPSCGAKKSAVVDRKYLVTSLRRCEQCSLLYRAPTSSIEENRDFYQEEYSQGFTSDLPNDAELDRLVRTKFLGSEKDYAQYIAVLRALGVSAGDKILDFGCSWGYGSWQLKEAGYLVRAFEISRPRCKFAKERLNIDACDDLKLLGDSKFDVLFSAHVLEHVPSVAAVFELARQVVRPGGLVVSFTPNGSRSFRQKNFGAWRQLWGDVHPNLLDDEFYKAHCPQVILATSPYDLAELTKKDRIGGEVGSLMGAELLAAFRLPVA